MIVECIRAPRTYFGNPVIKGNLYEVIGEKIAYDTKYYKLKELPDGYWRHDLFKEINIDISDAMKEEKLETVL